VSVSKPNALEGSHVLRRHPLRQSFPRAERSRSLRHCQHPAPFALGLSRPQRVQDREGIGGHSCNGYRACHSELVPSPTRWKEVDAYGTIRLTTASLREAFQGHEPSAGLALKLMDLSAGTGHALCFGCNKTTRRLQFHELRAGECALGLVFLAVRAFDPVRQISIVARAVKLMSTYLGGSGALWWLEDG
jgi:hypothetical protein